MTTLLRTTYLHCCATLVALCWFAPSARADLVTSYNVFAGHEVRLSGFINSAGTPAGPIGSNLDVRTSASGRFSSLAGGGTLYGTGIGPDISGNVTFGGNVNLSALTTVGGNVAAGGNANLQGTISGDVIAAATVNSKAAIAGDLIGGGNVTTSALGLVAGNLISNGDVHAGANVTGNVNYGLGHTISTSPGVSIGGSVTTSNYAIVPPAFDPVVFPAAHAIATGATNISLAAFASKTIAPGHYGHLTLAGSNIVNLSAGDYYFADLTMTGAFLTLNYNLTSGPINVYIEGSALFKNAEMKVNGVSYSAINPALATQINFEAHGNIDANTSNLFGTFYAPTGDITIKGLSNVTGGVYAGHDVIADSANFYLANGKNTCVPEPSTYAMAVTALLAGLPLLVARLSRRPAPRRNRKP